MEWFKLIMTIFYAVTISINIVGIYASIKSIRKYKDTFFVFPFHKLLKRRTISATIALKRKALDRWQWI